jgi:hypothetical protein
MSKEKIMKKFHKEAITDSYARDLVISYRKHYRNEMACSHFSRDEDFSEEYKLKGYLVVNEKYITLSKALIEAIAYAAFNARADCLGFIMTSQNDAFLEGKFFIVIRAGIMQSDNISITEKHGVIGRGAGNVALYECGIQGIKGSITPEQYDAIKDTIAIEYAKERLRRDINSKSSQEEQISCLKEEFTQEIARMQSHLKKINSSINVLSEEIKIVSAP